MGTARQGKVPPATKAFRQVIRELVHGLRAVPKEVREEWQDELCAEGLDPEGMSPDDRVVRLVLINLNVAEGAYARSKQVRPRLYSIVRDINRDHGRKDDGGLLAAG
jgi:hypothetical protein